MRVLVLALAFVSVVVNGQESKPHSDTYKRHAATERTGTPDTAGQTVIVVNQQAPQGQENNHPSQRPSHLHEYLLPANVLTLALVLVGIGGIIAAVVTLRKIDEQITEMRRQVDVMFGQLRAMHEQVAEMSAQTGLLTDYVTETKTIANAGIVSANAAKTSADIAAAELKQWVDIGEWKEVADSYVDCAINEKREITRKPSTNQSDYSIQDFQQHPAPADGYEHKGDKRLDAHVLFSYYCLP